MDSESKSGNETEPMMSAVLRDGSHSSRLVKCTDREALSYRFNTVIAQREELRKELSNDKQTQPELKGIPRKTHTSAVETSRRMLYKTALNHRQQRIQSRLTAGRTSCPSALDEESTIEDFIKEGGLVEEFGHIATPRKFKIQQTVNTEVFAYFPTSQELNGGEFWLMSAIIDCADYATTAAMLESGVIQYAVTSCRKDATQEIRVLLITLLRLASSCFTHAHLLSCIQVDLFALLFDCLRTNRTKTALFDTLVIWGQFSDSRAYSTFLAIAYGAHTRPINVQHPYMTAEEILVYEQHVQYFCAAYGPHFLNPKGYLASLPPHLAGYHDTFYLSDMAAEVFLDLAPHGFFSNFATCIDLKWDRCFNQYLEHAPFSYATINLYRVLHQAPLLVAAHLSYPFSIYRHCFAYLSWGLRTILDNDFYRNSSNPESWNRPRVHVPLQFCTSCAETLRTFLDFPGLGGSASHQEVRDFMRRPKVIYQLLRFVLAMPNIVDVKKDTKLDLLYSAVWSLIHATSYTFPMMFNTLVDFVCDPTTPYCLSTHAAAYVAVAVSFARVPLKRSEILAVYKCLFQQLKLSSSEPQMVIRRRQELVFRMAVILCPHYFGVKSHDHRGTQRILGDCDELDKSDIDNSGVLSVSQIFEPYDFKPEDDRELTVEDPAAEI